MAIGGMLVFALAVTLAGCGGSSLLPGGTGQAQMGTLATETTYLRPFGDNPNQTPRWMDIADYLYSSVFRDTFEYPTSTVVLSYTTQEAPLRFTVSAPSHALKPNFCYQMKLEGPSQPWSNESTGADFENYQLGSNGRWWCDTCDCPLTDQEIESGEHTGHRVKGYLYFDFLVTKKGGSAEQTSTANNSYHVTWKTRQRRPGPNDGPIGTYTVVANPDGWAYNRGHRTVNVGLYGEWEPGRPLPGQVALAPGTYEGVEFRLTEESFHSSRPYGGNWRTVLVASSLAFEIGGNQSPLADAGPDQTGLIGEELTFDGSGSYDADGTIASCEWDFGDGGGATGEVVTHAYSSEGTYTVTLTVTDDDGASDTDTCLATVTSDGGTGAIAGKVTAGSGRGVAGATVTVVETGQSALTNKVGRYGISDVPAGTYSMTATKDGVGSDQADSVQVVAGQTTKRNFDLAP